jgi:hypothetical protein
MGVKYSISIFASNSNAKISPSNQEPQKEFRYTQKICQMDLIQIPESRTLEDLILNVRYIRIAISREPYNIPVTKTMVRFEVTKLHSF